MCCLSLLFSVKVAVIRCNEKIKSASEKYKESKEELDVKVRLLLITANDKANAFNILDITHTVLGHVNGACSSLRFKHIHHI